jgi:putative RNA 2'-phosphotransferase
MNQRFTTISKFLSKYLRHEPKALGLTLEPGGWILVDDLLSGAARIGFAITTEELTHVVRENDKNRFSFDDTGQRIRANQGHSTHVDLQLRTAHPPAELFHGTVAKFLNAILQDGLKKMARHDVHLSKDIATAAKVGQRRGKPMILVIESGRMAADGFTFHLSDNDVWLTDHVPPQYIRVLEEEDD